MFLWPRWCCRARVSWPSLASLNPQAWRSMCGWSTPTPRSARGSASRGTARSHRPRARDLADVTFPLSVPPKVLEPVGRHFGVPDGVLNALVPEVVLQGPRVVAIVGEQRKSGIMRGIFCFRTPAQLHHRRYPARRASRRDRTEGRRGAGRAPPRARDRTRPSSRARPKHDVELRMESRTGDEKRAAVAGGSKGETGRCPGRCSSSALVG